MGPAYPRRQGFAPFGRRSQARALCRRGPSRASWGASPVWRLAVGAGGSGRCGVACGSFAWCGAVVGGRAGLSPPAWVCVAGGCRVAARWAVVAVCVPVALIRVVGGAFGPRFFARRQRDSIPPRETTSRLQAKRDFGSVPRLRGDSGLLPSMALVCAALKKVGC
ncbi:MAG: hypothetical protein IPL59_18210 [Candidatus Competibacteraceae bacterium]|nr:hypothetical protein [Candidatus Competibacteraceae bacterium]